MSERRPRRRYHHGDLRRALLESATAWVVERGADTFSLREISQGLGVSPMAAYRHFPHRDSLLAAVAQQGFESLEAALSAAVSGHETPPEQLLAAGHAYVTFGRRQPRLLHLMFGIPLPPWTQNDAPADEGAAALARAAGAAYRRLEDVIQAGMRAGCFRSEAPRALVVGAWAVVHGLAMLGDAGRMTGGMSTEDVEQVLRYWISGITAVAP
ncbi:MAG: TetR/AcrR family transcriptional regulator [Pigmentiphaga sp.]|nr:TetR/AcrR family transcriptional regulator [Pigmentiphaga sp.]